MTQGGFSGFRAGEPRWGTFNLTNGLGQLVSVHTFMMDSFVHFLDVSGTCVCGPHVVVYDNPMFGPVSYVVHNEWDDPMTEPPPDELDMLVDLE